MLVHTFFCVALLMCLYKVKLKPAEFWKVSNDEKILAFH